MEIEDKEEKEWEAALEAAESDTEDKQVSDKDIPKEDEV